MANLADVVAELQKQNADNEKLVDRIDQLVSNTSVINAVNALLNPLKSIEDKFDRVITDQNVTALKLKELSEESSKDKAVERLKSAETQRERPKNFIEGLKMGTGFAVVEDFVHSVMVGIFGKRGTLLQKILGFTGFAVGRLGIAGLVYTFGESVIGGFFKWVNDNYKLDFSQDQIDGITSRINDGLVGFLITSVFTKNPFFRLAGAIVGAYRDEILNAIKSVFGIKQDESGNVTADIPILGQIDLGESMSLVEMGVLGLATALGGAIIKYTMKAARLGIGKMIGTLLGKTPAAATAAGVGAGAVKLSAQQTTKLTALSDDVLKAAGYSRNSAGQIVNAATKGFASNAELVNLLAAQKYPRFGRLLSAAGKKLPLIGALITAGTLGAPLMNDELSEDEKIEQVGGLIGSTLGGISGAAAGGTIAGILGLTTGPGAILTGFTGAVLGGFAGDWAGQEMARYMITGRTSENVPEGVTSDITFPDRALSESAYVNPANEFAGVDDYQSSPIADIIKPIMTAPASNITSGIGSYAQQSVGSARIAMGRGKSGDELNALDAMAANNVVINNYIDNSDNSSSTSVSSNGGRSGASSTPLPSRDYESYDWYTSGTR